MHHSEQIPDKNGPLGRMLSDMHKEPPTLEDELSDAAKKHGLGATGKAPMGKIDPTDEGEIRFGIARYEGKVILNFGKPVAWAGWTANQAIALAKTLQHHANVILGK